MLALKSREVSRLSRLVHARLLTPEDLDAAAQESVKTGRSVESILISRHHISKKAIGYALRAFYGLTFLEYVPGFAPAPELTKGIDPALLRKGLWVPLMKAADVVFILTDASPSESKFRMIRRFYPEQRLRFCVGLPEDILSYIDTIGAPAAPARRAGSLARWLAGIAEGLRSRRKHFLSNS